MNDFSKQVAVTARQLVRCAVKAVLCTSMSEDQFVKGYPFGSLVTIATAWDGSPILLLSSLAQHTKNIVNDEYISLLVDGTDGYHNPQQGPRVGVIGRLSLTHDEKLGRRFLRRHPQAAMYANFSDFQFFKIEVEKYHYVGGFAQALWIGKRNAVLPRKDWVNVAESEEEILLHMNSDHLETLKLYGTKLIRKRGKHWTMVSLDPEGIDLRCGNIIHRVNFPAPATNPHDIRKTLIQMSVKAKIL